MKSRKVLKLNELTFEKLLDTYEAIASTERVKMGKPSARRVQDGCNAIRYVLREVNISIKAKVTTMTRKRFDEFAVKAIERGVSSISVRTYLGWFNNITAKWTHNYYRERKMQIPKFDAPRVFVEPTRYKRPSEETTRKVLDWYKGLERKTDVSLWAAVAMMFEFAMRNGDVQRLTWANFKRSGDNIYLEYTPHKTAKSSGRRVYCRVASHVYSRLSRLRGKNATDCTPLFTSEDLRKKTQQINKTMRQFGFNGSKASYELRKLCVDSVYKNFGVEAASAISGDDIRTVLKYYADGRICDFGNIRVSDIMMKKCTMGKL